MNGSWIKQAMICWSSPSIGVFVNRGKWAFGVTLQPRTLRIMLGRWQYAILLGEPHHKNGPSGG